MLEVILLGAFGCGVFQNSPEVVARAMKEVVKNYLYSFKTIEFAVYYNRKIQKAMMPLTRWKKLPSRFL